MYKVLIHPLAKEDIREAATWYDKQQKELGKSDGRSLSIVAF